MMPFSVILGMFPVKSLQRTAGPPFTLPPRREGTLPPVSSRRATDRTGGGGAVICTTKYPKAQILPHISGRDVTSGPAPQETHGRFGARPRRRRGGRPGPRTPPQPLRPAFPGPLSRSGPEFPGRRPPPPSATPVAVAMTTRTARRQTPTFRSRRSESPRLYHVGQPPFPRAVRNFLSGALARAAALPWERGGEVAAGPGPGPGPGGDPCAPERGEERAGLRGWVWCRLL